MDFLVGTFNYEAIYTVHFSPPTSPTSSDASLTVIRPNPAIAAHSWLSFSPSRKNLYATAWTQPNPSIASYRLSTSGREVSFLNAKPVSALPGYVCANKTHVFSVGGPTGEVFRLEADGSIGPLVQSLDFITDQGENMSEARGEVPHGSYGGLRHGAHSVDLSPDGRSLYVADIGRNCIWTYAVDTRITDVSSPPLKLGDKYISPRAHDGPRHTWPHPNGRVLYCLQEHSSMVDVFGLREEGTKLEHVQGVKIIPAEEDVGKYWADEVRLSTGPDAGHPQYLYASTRGLEKETKGYVAVFPLNMDGTLAANEAIDCWQTPTAGGIANAIEPAPWIPQTEGVGHVQYLAMTETDKGWVSILSFDGKKIREVAKTLLSRIEGDEAKQEEPVKPATAIWLDNEAGMVNFNRHR